MTDEMNCFLHKHLAYLERTENTHTLHRHSYAFRYVLHCFFISIKLNGNKRSEGRNYNRSSMRKPTLVILSWEI